MILNVNDMRIQTHPEIKMIPRNMLFNFDNKQSKRFDAKILQTLEAKCYANVDEKRKCCEKKFMQGSDFFTKISSFYNFCNLLKAKLDTLYSDSDTRVSFVQNS